MKAGGSQLPATVFVFICNLFFVTSHQPPDLQVRVKFVIVIRLIPILMESGFGECCFDVSECCCCCFFLTTTLFNHRYVDAAAGQFQTTAKWVSFASSLLVG